MEVRLVCRKRRCRTWTTCRLSALMLTCVGALLCEIASGQQVTTDPASTHVFPAGGRRGTVVKARFGGECLPPETRLRFDESPGIRASERLTDRSKFVGELSPRRKPGEQHINYPKEWNATIEIAADAAIGPHYWWLASARGGTGARSFIVGDLPEYIERETNSRPELAEQVTMPVVLNGQIDGERDMDYFQFHANHDEVVVLDVVAARIGSPLEAVVDVRDSRGKRIHVQEVRVGGDAVIAFRAPASDQYRFSIANLSTPGGPSFVYRITLSTEPYFRLAFPSGGVVNQPVDVDLLTLTGGSDFSHVTKRITMPLEPREIWWSDSAIRYPIPLRGSTLPSFIETEPNNDVGTANRVPVSTAFHGRLVQADDEDWFQVPMEAGRAYSVEIESAGVGLASLPIVSIVGKDGTVLANASAVDTPDRRPAIEAFAPAAAGDYWVRVRDVQQGVRGGEDFVYRGSIQLAKHDFELSLKTDAANHLPGGRTEIDVLVRRRGGFNGPIRVSAEGLPDGVKAEPLELPPNAPAGKLVLTSDAMQTPPSDALIQIVGAAEIDGATITRTARAPHLGRDVEGVAIGPSTIDRFHLTVMHKPPFRLFCSEAYQYAHRGSIYPYLMQVERFDGFQGPITLQLADRQIKCLDGIELVEVTIPEGHNQIMLPIYLPETMHINVQAHSNVYAHGVASFKDRWGHDQTTCIISEMRCMIRTLPTTTKLRAAETDLRWDARQEAQCRLTLDRTPLFTGTLRIEAINLPSDGSISVTPATIGAGETNTIVNIRSMQGPSSEPTRITLRGTGDLGDGATVVTEATVSIRGETAKGTP